MSFAEWRENCASQTSTNLAFLGGAVGTGAMLTLMRGNLGAASALTVAAASSAIGIHATAAYNDDFQAQPAMIRFGCYGALTVGALASGYALLGAWSRPFPSTSRELIESGIAPLLGAWFGAGILARAAEYGATGDNTNYEKDMKLVPWACGSCALALGSAWMGHPTATALLTVGMSFMTRGGSEDSQHVTTAKVGAIVTLLVSAGLVGCDLANGVPFGVRMLAINGVRLGTCGLAVWLLANSSS